MTGQEVVSSHCSLFSCSSIRTPKYLSTSGLPANFGLYKVSFVRLIIKTSSIDPILPQLCIRSLFAFDFCQDFSKTMYSTSMALSHLALFMCPVTLSSISSSVKQRQMEKLFNTCDIYHGARAKEWVLVHRPGKSHSFS